MTVYEASNFYLEGGKCSHEDAPEPNQSDCIGKDACGAWEDDIGYKAKVALRRQENDNI